MRRVHRHDETIGGLIAIMVLVVGLLAGFWMLIVICNRLIEMLGVGA